MCISIYVYTYVCMYVQTVSVTLCQDLIPEVIPNQYYCSLFYDAVSLRLCSVQRKGDMMKWKGFGRKRSCLILRYHPVIRLEELRNSTENVSQDSQSPGRDLNPGSRSVKHSTTTFGSVRNTVRTYIRF
jgi:hypothetical protein